jgi:hypothetical protein
MEPSAHLTNPGIPNKDSKEPSAHLTNPGIPNKDSKEPSAHLTNPGIPNKDPLTQTSNQYIPNGITYGTVYGPKGNSQNQKLKNNSLRPSSPPLNNGRTSIQGPLPASGGVVRQGLPSSPSSPSTTSPELLIQTDTTKSEPLNTSAPKIEDSSTWKATENANPPADHPIAYNTKPTGIRS